MQDLQHVSSLAHDIYVVVTATVHGVIIDKHLWMAVVPCAAHRFNDLCMDLGKDMPAFHDVLEAVHLIISTITVDSVCP